MIKIGVDHTEKYMSGRGQRGIMQDLKLNNYSISDEFWILPIISTLKNTR